MPLILENAPSVEFRQVAGLFIASFARPSFSLNDEETTRKTTGTTENAKETPQNPSKPLKAPQRHLKDVLLTQLAELNHTSLDSIRHHLLALQSAGRIRHIGPSRGGYWEMLDRQETGGAA
jgi:ATP-dependent DNA helicase RecG